MDTVTQAALGAAFGLIAAPRHGRRAILIGAAAGVLPDLDSLAGALVGDVEKFVTHRSLTHSLIVQPVAAAVGALVMPLWRNGFGLSRAEWFRLLMLCFVTHTLLDLTTTYGTQIFWPITKYPYALSIAFIIDPTYSMILAIGLVTAWFAKDDRIRRRAVQIAVGATTAYLLLAGALKLQAQAKFEETLADAESLDSRAFIVQNTPFNIFLWHAIAVGDQGVSFAYCRSPCRSEQIKFETDLYGPHQAEGESWIPESEELQMLASFSKGLYQIKEKDGKVYFVDLRFGSGDVRVFSFHFADVVDGELVPVEGNLRQTPLSGPGEFNREFKKIFSHW